MPVQFQGKTYLTPEELDTNMHIFIREQAEISRRDLHEIGKKQGIKHSEQELVLL